jgi:hypothetical protein
VGSCTTLKDSTFIEVNANPATPTPVTNNGPLCEGDFLLLEAAVISNVSYHWEGPNGFIATGSTATINTVNALDHQGIYSVYVVDSTTACVSDKEFNLVMINELPDANMVLNNSPVCEIQL